MEVILKIYEIKKEKKTAKEPPALKFLLMMIVVVVLVGGGGWGEGGGGGSQVNGNLGVCGQELSLPAFSFSQCGGNREKF